MSYAKSTFYYPGRPNVSCYRRWGGRGFCLGAEKLEAGNLLAVGAAESPTACLEPVEGSSARFFLAAWRIITLMVFLVPKIIVISKTVVYSEPCISPISDVAVSTHIYEASIGK